MLILLLFGVLLAWQLQRIIYRRYWSLNLSAAVRFSQPYTYEGETSFFQEEITNNKFLPIPALEVRIVTSRNLEFGGEAKQNTSISDQSYLRDVFAFFGYQKVIRKIPFYCRKRGRYEVKKAELVGYDLLYENKYYLEQEQDTLLYVYPKQVDVSRIRLICQAISGMVLTQRRLYPDPFEFSGIREYQRTDPMNRINWKASARSGDLMVNQYDSTTNIQVTLVLDVQDSGILKYQELVEESIRIASTLSAELVHRNVELDLYSNAHAAEYTVDSKAGSKAESVTELKEERNAEHRTDSQAYFCMHLKSGTGQMQQLNQYLACIDTAGTMNADGEVSAGTEIKSLCELLQAEELQRQNGRIFVLLSKNKTAENAVAVRTLAAHGNQVLWVVPVHPHMERGPAFDGISELIWEVG